MKRIVLLLMFFISLLFGKEMWIVTHQNFPLKHISPKQLRAIFLGKKHYIKEQKLLPINYNFTDPRRLCFEKEVLKKSQRALTHYWLKAHYHGRRAPKVVKSKAALLKYLQEVPGAIGYVDANTSLKPSLKILLKIPCL